MNYDFTTIMDRHGKDSIAVDAPEELLQGGKTKAGYSRIPMWVADMDFPTAPSVVKAIEERLQTPSFGYFDPSDDYYDAIIQWQQNHNGMTISKAEIGYDNGVLGGVISTLNVLCSRGDEVLLHAPCYIGFTGALENAGYRIVHSALKKDEQNVWRMDFKDMEEKIAAHHIHVMILCNPHNPCGRAWSREELEQLVSICERHQVWIIEDAIWSDLLLNGNHYVPVQSISTYARMHTAAMYAPSKTFSLAGITGSYHIIYHHWLYDRVEKESSLCHYNEMNVLWMHALTGAYSREGEEWLEQLKAVLSDNINTAVQLINRELPGVSVSKPEGTYMLLLDCREYCEKTNTSMDTLLKRGIAYGVLWQDGRPFFMDYGIRMNFAVPHRLALEALQRMKEHIFVDSDTEKSIE